MPPAPTGGRGPRDERTRWAAWIAGLCLVLTVLQEGGPGHVRDAGGVLVPGLTVGTTHTERSADPWNPEEALSRSAAVLATVAPLQNQHLMGWGAGNPEPRPGAYDFRSLDRRIDMIVATGSEPVITLCCAPDWMKGGKPGTTDWGRLEEAPAEEHFDDFAHLAQVVAERYPQVRHFMVWNELKGFYDRERNTWDAAAYTDMYNRVYRAVREVRPDALLGGPYVVMDSWQSRWAGGHPSAVRGSWGILDQRPLDVLEYWLAEAEGADFVVLDGRTGTRDAGLTTTDFEATAKLAAVTEWVRDRTDLPVWWAEIYADCSDGSLPCDEQREAAVMVDALVAVARAGASVALLWGPQGRPGRTGAALFSDTAERRGGRALPLATLLQALQEQLREDPWQVTTSWYPDRAAWALRTPEWVVLWSPGAGLVGPVARDPR